MNRIHKEAWHRLLDEVAQTCRFAPPSNPDQRRWCVAAMLLLVFGAVAPVRAAVTLKDDTGHPFRLAHPARRIVSLAPGLTELVYDVGAGRRLVGVSAYSNFPPAARRLPRVGDAFHMDIEKITALHPDLILAWRGSTPKAARVKLGNLGFTVATLGAQKLKQVAGDLLTIGRAVGHAQAARTRATSYLDALAKLRKAYSSRMPLRVFYEISAEPLYTVGGKQIISQIIALCGGRNIFAGLGSLAPAVSREAVLTRDPQVILTAGESRSAAKRLAQWRRWPQLSAAKAGNFFQLKPGNIARATPRILKGGRKVCRDLQLARRRLKTRSAH